MAGNRRPDDRRKQADETHALIPIARPQPSPCCAGTSLPEITKQSSRRSDCSTNPEHQSEEGWFKEYDGADPGYQTLCLLFADVQNYALTLNC